MNSPTGFDQSVARRLALMSLGGLAVVLLAVSVAIGFIEHSTTHALMVTSVAERVQSIVAVADASDQISRELVQRSYKIFRQNFEATPVLNADTGDLTSYGSVVNNEFGSVDEFNSDTGGVATVFAKKAMSSCA